MTRQTAGKLASDLMLKSPDSTDPIEIQRKMQEEYMKELLDCVDAGYKKYPGNFFIVVETKNEKLLPNVFRNYFINRQTCPTPNYDQSVFRYNREAGQIEYIWTVPSRDASHHLKDNMLIVAKEERDLLNFVLKFDDGTLYKICKKFNNEKDETPELIQ